MLYDSKYSNAAAKEIANPALVGMSKLFLSITVTALVVLIGVFYIALLRL
jgi:hypothetical protein